MFGAYAAPEKAMDGIKRMLGFGMLVETGKDIWFFFSAECE
jgi:hypothetical protein